MKNNLSKDRMNDAIELRRAAMTLLENHGVRDGSKQDLWYNRHTPQNPEPHIAINITQTAVGRQTLNIWGRLGDKHVKVFNVDWVGETLEIVTFRRGEWENELLAMNRAPGISVQ